MVFDKPQTDKQVVRLHSDPTAVEHHRIWIQLKGPTFGSDFIDGANDYEKDEDIELEVMGGPRGPEWHSAAIRPFRIVTLHPPSQALGELVYERDKFFPTFTINTGTLYSDDETKDITFENDATSEPLKDPVPREVVVKIDLTAGQEATLKSKHLREVDLSKGNWEIVVRITPAFRMQSTNFISFMLFGLSIEEGRHGEPCRPNKQYRAKGTSCSNFQSCPVIPERPCCPD